MKIFFLFVVFCSLVTTVIAQENSVEINIDTNDNTVKYFIGNDTNEIWVNSFVYVEFSDTFKEQVKFSIYLDNYTKSFFSLVDTNETIKFCFLILLKDDDSYIITYNALNYFNGKYQYKKDDPKRYMDLVKKVLSMQRGKYSREEIIKLDLGPELSPNLYSLSSFVEFCILLKKAKKNCINWM